MRGGGKKGEREKETFGGAFPSIIFRCKRV